MKPSPEHLANINHWANQWLPKNWTCVLWAVIAGSTYHVSILRFRPTKWCKTADAWLMDSTSDYLCTCPGLATTPLCPVLPEAGVFRYDPNQGTWGFIPREQVEAAHAEDAG